MGLSSNFSLAIFTLLVSLSIWTSFSKHQLDSDKCIVPRMWVAYAPIEDFTTSRLADKYGLYLVKSSPYDIPLPVRPEGVPVLFVPGNAGSYRQIRSISDTCRELQETYGVPEIDFFALDFNEAYSALHGTTLLDQAEYLNDAIRHILSMYETDVKSVILLGHSMGGVVSRVALSLDNYEAGTVNTIFTLASPHLTPPATFDGDISKVYNLMNDFWRESFVSEQNPLEDVTILSIAGGKRDTMVPSDYISLDSIVPESNGLSTFSNSVNRVWTGIDHDAMMWCHQLRRQIGVALLSVIGKPKQERMDVFRRVFGVETAASEEVEFNLDTVSSLPLVVQKKILTPGFYFGRNVQFITTHAVNMNVLESHEMKAGSDLKAYACRSKSGMDFRGCKKIHPLLVPGRDDQVFAYGKTEKYLLLEVTTGSEDWISVDEIHTKEATIGDSIITDNTVTSDYYFPSITSGLLSYKVYVSRGIELIRQYVEHDGSRVYDSKYLTPSTGFADISFSGQAPFVPHQSSSPLHLQVFGTGKLIVKVDWAGSLGNLFMRYRTLMFSLPSAVVYAVLLVQFRQYAKTGEFVSFRQGANTFISKYLFVSCLFVSLIAYLTGFSKVRDILHLIQIPYTAPNKNFHVEFIHGTKYTYNDLFVGLGGAKGAVLAPFFLLLSTGVVVIVSELVGGITTLLSYCLKNTDVVSSANITGDLLRKRSALIAIISTLTFLYFPYHVAFTAATLTLWFLAASCKSNYVSSMSVVMTWTCLANAPVLAVWIQGIVVQRSAVFSSHHNLLSILPTLLFVQSLSLGRVPQVSSVTYLLLTYTSLHCLLYGMTQAFMIHQAFNLLVGWLLVESYRSKRVEVGK